MNIFVLTYPLPDLLNRPITVCCAEIMLTKKDIFGHSMLKPHKNVLPIPYMIPETDVENHVAEVESVEEEPECVNNAFSFVNIYQKCRSIASSAMLIFSPSFPSSLGSLITKRR
jgi:hypothetical protein